MTETDKKVSAIQVVVLEHAVDSYVIIKELAQKGRIALISYDGNSVEYKVKYNLNGTFIFAWFYADELEKII